MPSEGTRHKVTAGNRKASKVVVRVKAARRASSHDGDVDDATVPHELDHDRQELMLQPEGTHEKVIVEDPDEHPEPPAEMHTIFDLGDVEDPLTGTPKEVQKELDGLALRIQRRPRDHASFDRIVAYMHKYLLGLVFKKYSFIRGYEECDIYQEALIALFKKAIPNFNPRKNMSFLNFAKMCINRHLITILHASKHRRKDMPINTAVSLDHNPSGSDDDDDGGCTLANIIPDEKNSDAPFKDLSRRESFHRTLSVMRDELSEFEVVVLEEYLAEKSYREAAKCISRKLKVRCNEKSVDNALLRIRKKALDLLGEKDIDKTPLMT